MLSEQATDANEVTNTPRRQITKQNIICVTYFANHVYCQEKTVRWAGWTSVGLRGPSYTGHTSPLGHSYPVERAKCPFVKATRSLKIFPINSSSKHFY